MSRLPVRVGPARDIVRRPFVLLVLGLVGVAAWVPGTGQSTVSYPDLSVPPVLLTLSPDFPTAGSLLTVDVATFAAGVAVDADAVPTASAQVNGATHSLLLHSIGTGRYEGAYLLPAANLSAFARMYDGLIVVDALVQGAQQSTGARFRWFGPGLALRVSADTSRIVPGEPVELTGRVLRDGMLVDPDTIQAAVMQYSTPLGENATPVRVGQGTYVANVTFSRPWDFTYLPLATMTATLGGVTFSGGMYLQVPHYQVWLHGLPSLPGELQGEIWVANWTGGAAPGVGLSFPAPNGSIVSGSTDSRGAFPIDVNAPGSLGWSAVLTVAAGTPYADHVGIGYVPSQLPTVLPLDPVILPDGTPRDYLRPNQPVTRTFRLLNATASLVPYVDTTVSYYVYSLQRVVASGVASTNATGAVTVSFTAPREGAQVAFLATSRLVGFADFLVGSPTVSMTSGPLVVGGLTDVDLSLREDLEPALDADASLVWDVRPLELASGETWTRLSRSFDDAVLRTNDSLRHVFALPGFLPSSSPILVSAMFGLEPSTFAQFAVVRPGETASVPFNATYRAPSAGSPDALSSLVAIGGIAIAVSVAAVWLIRRRKPPQGK